MSKAQLARAITRTPRQSVVYSLPPGIPSCGPSSRWPRLSAPTSRSCRSRAAGRRSWAKPLAACDSLPSIGFCGIRPPPRVDEMPGVVYYRTPNDEVPAEDFLDSCPSKVEATILAVLGPSGRASAGLQWRRQVGGNARRHARRLQIRVTGPGRKHYRLFCVVDNGSPEELAARGFREPQIAAINGMVKDHMTEFSDSEYRTNVRKLGDDYLTTFPRRIASAD